MGNSFDVIVIGGGVAGVSAALAARAGGASVALIRSSPGATAVTSGGWSGPLPAVVGDALAAAGLACVPVAHLLPHPFGDLRAHDYAAESHAGALASPGGVVCGISGLAGFSAPALARLYADASNPPVAHVTVALPGSPPDGWAPHALAAALERDPALFAGGLAGRMPRGATHLVCPAVLGLDGVATVRAAIGDALGVPVFEALGAPPSIPGWRLDRALLRGARAAGVTIIAGRAQGHEPGPGAVTSLHVESAQGARTITAPRYVLATGKFIGGGIAAVQQKLTENALGLPVWIEHLDQSFTTADSLTLTSRVRTYDQPLMKAGVHANPASQPIDARDRIVFSNVAVAGAVLAGRDCASLGLGDAAEQGVRAGTVTAGGVR